jgi:hypothetical protein
VIISNAYISNIINEIASIQNATIDNIDANVINISDILLTNTVYVNTTLNVHNASYLEHTECNTVYVNNDCYVSNNLQVGHDIFCENFDAVNILTSNIISNNITCKYDLITHDANINTMFVSNLLECATIIVETNLYSSNVFVDNAIYVNNLVKCLTDSYLNRVTVLSDATIIENVNIYGNILGTDSFLTTKAIAADHAYANIILSDNVNCDYMVVTNNLNSKDITADIVNIVDSLNVSGNIHANIIHTTTLQVSNTIDAINSNFFANNIHGYNAKIVNNIDSHIISSDVCNVNYIYSNNIDVVHTIYTNNVSIVNANINIIYSQDIHCNVLKSNEISSDIVECSIINCNISNIEKCTINKLDGNIGTIELLTTDTLYLNNDIVPVGNLLHVPTGTISANNINVHNNFTCNILQADNIKVNKTITSDTIITKNIHVDDDLACHSLLIEGSGQVRAQQGFWCDHNSTILGSVMIRSGFNERPRDGTEMLLVEGTARISQVHVTDALIYNHMEIGLLDVQRSAHISDTVYAKSLTCEGLASANNVIVTSSITCVGKVTIESLLQVKGSAVFVGDVNIGSATFNGSIHASTITCHSDVYATNITVGSNSLTVRAAQFELINNCLCRGDLTVNGTMALTGALNCQNKLDVGIGGMNVVGSTTFQAPISANEITTTKLTSNSDLIISAGQIVFGSTFITQDSFRTNDVFLRVNGVLNSLNDKIASMVTQEQLELSISSLKFSDVAVNGNYDSLLNKPNLLSAQESQSILMDIQMAIVELLQTAQSLSCGTNPFVDFASNKLFKGFKSATKTNHRQKYIVVEEEYEEVISSEYVELQSTDQTHLYGRLGTDNASLTSMIVPGNAITTLNAGDSSIPASFILNGRLATANTENTRDVETNMNNFETSSILTYFLQVGENETNVTTDIAFTDIDDLLQVMYYMQENPLVPSEFIEDGIEVTFSRWEEPTVLSNVNTFTERSIISNEVNEQLLFIANLRVFSPEYPEGQIEITPIAFEINMEKEIFEEMYKYQEQLQSSRIQNEDIYVDFISWTKLG